MSNNRYKVIADYPSSHIPVGDIVHAFTDALDAFYSKYPHLFRLLKWWEHVPIDELPKYVKWGSGNSVHVHKIESYEFTAIFANVYANTNEGESLLLSDCDHPATEAEYNEYINKLNSK